MIKTIHPKPKQRILITSDVHGNLKLFKSSLKSLNFGKDDILIINGDISEKGDNSIELFQYIIDLAKDYHVHLTMGNCDDLLNNLHLDEKNEGMQNYMETRPKTILSEFTKVFGKQKHFQDLKELAKKHYPEIFELVLNLPEIIETPYFTAVHAGMTHDEDQDRRFNLQVPAFYEQDIKFEKPLIVGHYPVCLYNSTYICHNPIIDRDKNIFSIDGGNVIKNEGQLNFIEFVDETFHVHSFDNLEYQDLGIHQEAVPGLHMSWADREIEVLEIGSTFSKCKHLSSQTIIEVPNHYLDLDYSILINDYTDALLEVNEGDLVHVIFETEVGYYAKCKGYIGWLLK